MVEVPFLNYHTSVLLDKLRNGQDIYAHDINQALYGSSINKLVEPYFRYQASKTVVFRGWKANIRRNNAYLRGVRRVTNASSYQARSKRFSTWKSRKRSVYNHFSQGSSQRRSIWGRSIRGQRRFRYRYSY